MSERARPRKLYWSPQLSSRCTRRQSHAQGSHARRPTQLRTSRQEAKSAGAVDVNETRGRCAAWDKMAGNSRQYGAMGNGGQQVALKELCPEDKRRVRQLIEDLARVGTERELIQHRLKKEKRQFEERLTRMKYQQQSLARERHELASELRNAQLELQSYHTHPNLTAQQERIHGTSNVALSGNIRSQTLPSHDHHQHSMTHLSPAVAVPYHNTTSHSTQHHLPSSSVEQTCEGVQPILPKHPSAHSVQNQAFRMPSRYDSLRKRSAREAWGIEQEYALGTYTEGGTSAGGCGITSKEVFSNTRERSIPTVYSLPLTQPLDHQLKSSTATAPVTGSDWPSAVSHPLPSAQPYHQWSSHYTSQLPHRRSAVTATYTTYSSSVQRDVPIQSVAASKPTLTPSTVAPQPKDPDRSSPLPAVEEWTSLPPVAIPEPISKVRGNHGNSGTCVPGPVLREEESKHNSVLSVLPASVHEWVPLPPSHFSTPALTQTQSRHGQGQRKTHVNSGTQTVMHSSVGTQTTESPLPLLQGRSESPTWSSEADLQAPHPLPHSPKERLADGEVPNQPHQYSSGVLSTYPNQVVGKEQGFSLSKSHGTVLLPTRPRANSQLESTRLPPEDQPGGAMEEDSLEVLMATALHTAQSTVRAIKTLSRSTDVSRLGSTGPKDRSQQLVHTDIRANPTDRSCDLAASLNPSRPLSVSQLESGSQRTSMPRGMPLGSASSPHRQLMTPRCGGGGSRVQNCGVLAAQLHGDSCLEVTSSNSEDSDDSQLLQDLFFV